MAETTQPARTRFAPSPTGHLHLGGARTALYDYLLSKQTGGQFILRIEDTDRRRFVEGAEQELMDGLRWLGLRWDEGVGAGGAHAPYRQSERKEIYQRHARQLVESGHAFYCFCTPERLDQVRKEQQSRKETMRYDGLCRGVSLEEADRRIAAGERHVVRFKSPGEGVTVVRDVLRGEISVPNQTIDDYILVKSDGLALYHLAAMVDDHLMGVTHVIRGSEWLPTFPLHALIIRAFGWQEPQFLHLSVFLKPSGKGKMSKREAADLGKDGYSIFVKDLEGLGYLPEAVINWIALMGWSYDDHTEFFCMDDLVEKFSLERLNPSPAAINFTKLDHFNGLHIRALPVSDLARRLQPFFEAKGYHADLALLERITPLIQERMVTLDEGPENCGFFFVDEVSPKSEELVAKGLDAAQSLDVMQRAFALLSALSGMRLQTAEPPMRALVEEMSLTPGQVFGILRVAITGQRVSPPLFESMEILGKDAVVRRLEKALTLLRDMV